MSPGGDGVFPGELWMRCVSLCGQAAGGTARPPSAPGQFQCLWAQHFHFCSEQSCPSLSFCLQHKLTTKYLHWKEKKKTKQGKARKGKQICKLVSKNRGFCTDPISFGHPPWAELNIYVIPLLPSGTCRGRAHSGECSQTMGCTWWFPWKYIIHRIQALRRN